MLPPPSAREGLETFPPLLLLPAALAEDRENFTSRFRRAETFAHAPVVQEFCDGSEGTQMRLKLVLRDDEEDDKFDRRIIERVELDPLRRAPERRHHFLDPVRRSVRNRDAKPDAGTHRFLALLERGQNAVAILRFDFSLGDEEIDQLDDGAPTLRRFHLGNDLLRSE